ncbi:MAG: hypothetical protein E3J64_00610, partial [Anaerolineales bacterium]
MTRHEGCANLLRKGNLVLVAYVALSLFFCQSDIRQAYAGYALAIVFLVSGATLILTPSGKHPERKIGRVAAGVLLALLTC